MTARRCCNGLTSYWRRYRRRDVAQNVHRNTFGLRRRKEGAVDTGDRLLTPGEVAALFRVDPKTVTRWAAAGRISSIRTPGGHRRFRESEVRALLEGEEGLAAEAAEHHR